MLRASVCVGGGLLANIMGFGNNLTTITTKDMVIWARSSAL